ncbi:MAG TPA: flagellar basal body P-ring formation protein FlgA [Methylococcaceae bacterium]|nr:flagellar basal body P-ring formation protein FlgA [Methylococcaceae bacterium]
MSQNYTFKLLVSFILILYIPWCSAQPQVLHAHEDIRKGVAAFVAANQSGHYQTEVQKMDQRIKLSQCSDELSFSYPFETDSTIEIRCSEINNHWKIFLSVKNRPLYKGYSVNRILTTGYRLTETDLEPLYIPSSKLSPYLVDDPKSVIGFSLKQTLRPGHALLISDIEGITQIMVAKKRLYAGHSVTLADIRFKTVPLDKIPESAILEQSGIRNKVLIKTISAGHVYNITDFSHLNFAIISRSNLESGHIMNNTDLDVILQTNANPVSNHFKQKSQLIGRTLKRDISKGTILLPAMVENSRDIVPLITGKDMINVVITRETLQPDRKITASDLDSKQVKYYTTSMGYYTKAEDVIDLVPKRFISKGTMLRPSLLKKLDLIKKGAHVTITVTGQGFFLSNQGIALEPGGLNDEIQIKVTNSGKIITGIVDAVGKVKIIK